MTAPPVGAGPLRVAVPRAVVPPTTLVGETVKLTNEGSCGVIVSVAVAVDELYEAVRVAVVAVVTARVAILKLAVVPPGRNGVLTRRNRARTVR